MVLEAASSRQQNEHVGAEAEPASREDEIRTLLEAGRVEEALTRTVQVYGQELLAFIITMLRDHDAAEDVFSEMCENIWHGLETFRWESSLRTWLYTLARHASWRRARNGYGRRRVDLPSGQLPEMAAQARTQTLTYLKTETKTAVQRLRSELSSEEQALLFLRIDRGLAWNDIAVILNDDTGGDAPIDVARSAAALRKRFERAKQRLRELAIREGLIGR